MSTEKEKLLKKINGLVKCNASKRYTHSDFTDHHFVVNLGFIEAVTDLILSEYVSKAWVIGKLESI